MAGSAPHALSVACLHEKTTKAFDWGTVTCKITERCLSCGAHRTKFGSAFLASWIMPWSSPPISGEPK